MLALQALDFGSREIAGNDLWNVPQTEGIRRKILENHLAVYEALLESNSGDPDLIEENAKQLLIVSFLLPESGRSDSFL